FPYTTLFRSDDGSLLRHPDLALDQRGHDDALVLAVALLLPGGPVDGVDPLLHGRGETLEDGGRPGRARELVGVGKEQALPVGESGILGDLPQRSGDLATEQSVDELLEGVTGPLRQLGE